MSSGIDTFIFIFHRPWVIINAFWKDCIEDFGFCFALGNWRCILIRKLLLKVIFLWISTSWSAFALQLPWQHTISLLQWVQDKPSFRAQLAPGTSITEKSCYICLRPPTTDFHSQRRPSFTNKFPVWFSCWIISNGINLTFLRLQYHYGLTNIPE
jgi:hypothetical protein